MASYREAKEDNLLWIDSIKRTLEINGMLVFFMQEYPDKPDFVHNRTFKCLSDQFHQNALQSIKENGSKLRTYAIFKTEIGREKYLTEIKNVEMRKQLSKFRLSNHSLRIETGRYDHTPPELRYCPFCENLVETEIHFLFECPMYNTIRDIFLATVVENVPEFAGYDSNKKLEYVMTNINRDVAKLVSDCLDIRSFLVAKHKRSS